MTANPKFAHREYTAADHELAFTVWLETGSWQRSADSIGDNRALVITVKNWSRPDYPCQFACPFHGWVELKEKKEKMLQLSPFKSGAVEDAVAPFPPPVIVDATTTTSMTPEETFSSANIVRSDLERLQQWELLWAQAIFYGTGVVPTGLPLLGDDGRTRSEEELREHFNNLGLKPRSFESVIRVLVNIQRQIDDLTERSGLHKPIAKAEKAETAVVKEVHQLDLDALRAFKTLYDATPEDKRHALAQMFNSELGVLDSVQKTAGSNSGSDKVPNSSTLP